MSTARRFSVILVLGLLASAGCATGGEATESAEPAYTTDPVAPTPRVQIAWRRHLDTDVLGGYRARQYAAPGLLRTADRRDLVIGTDSGWLYRFRASDARERWKTELDGPIHASPLATASHVYAGTLYGTFYAVDRRTGEVAWKVDNDRGIEAEPAAGQGLVYYTTNAGRLVALDQAGGEQTWTYSRSIPKEFTVKGSGTPVVVGRSVFCGFADGVVASLDATTGAVNWTADISGDETEFTDVDLPVFVEGNRVYAVSYGAGVTALDRKTGEQIWSRSFDNVSSATLVEGRLYVTLAIGRVLALDIEDGSALWGFRMAENQPVDIVATGNYLFVSTGNGPLYILDRATGYPLRKWRPSPGVNPAVAFSKRAGYMFSNKGYLYSFRLAY